MPTLLGLDGSGPSRLHRLLTVCVELFGELDSHWRTIVLSGGMVVRTVIGFVSLQACCELLKEGEEGIMSYIQQPPQEFNK